MPNYFAILGLKEGANLMEIKQAYRKLSVLEHPDLQLKNLIGAAIKEKQLKPRTATEIAYVQKEAARMNISPDQVVVELTETELNTIKNSAHYKDVKAKAEERFKLIAQAYEILVGSTKDNKASSGDQTGAGVNTDSSDNNPMEAYSSPYYYIINNLSNQSDASARKKAQSVLWYELSSENVPQGGHYFRELSYLITEDLIAADLYQSFTQLDNVKQAVIIKKLQGNLYENHYVKWNENVSLFLFHHFHKQKKDDQLAGHCAQAYVIGRQVFDYLITKAQYDQIAAIQFNGRADKEFNKKYFNYLSPEDKAAVRSEQAAVMKKKAQEIVTNLSSQNLPSGENLVNLCHVLKDDRNLFNQALDNLANNYMYSYISFSDVHAQQLREIVSKYNPSSWSFFGKDNNAESKALAAIVKQFMLTRREGSLTTLDKVALYLMLKVYMENQSANEDDNQQTLTKDLKDVYGRLERNIENSGVLRLYQLVDPNKITEAEKSYKAIILQGSSVNAEALVQFSNVGGVSQQSQQQNNSVHNQGSQYQQRF